MNFTEPHTCIEVKLWGVAGVVFYYYYIFFIPERHGSESDEDNTHIVPKPAAPLNHQPLYLCLRISKKHWCRHQSAAGIILQQGEELHDRDQKRREYWFAIPPSRFVAHFSARVCAFFEYTWYSKGSKGCTEVAQW